MIKLLFSIVSVIAHQKFNFDDKMFFNEKIKINIFEGSVMHMK